MRQQEAGVSSAYLYPCFIPSLQEALPTSRKFHQRNEFDGSLGLEPVAAAVEEWGAVAQACHLQDTLYNAYGPQGSRGPRRIFHFGLEFLVGDCFQRSHPLCVEKSLGTSHLYKSRLLHQDSKKAIHFLCMSKLPRKVSVHMIM